MMPTLIEICENGTEKEVVFPKLGEIHFVSGKWDMEVVSHELMHAIIHCMRVLSPTATDVIEQVGESEEVICYLFGRWVDQVYRKLWESDPGSPGFKSTLHIRQ